MQEGSNKIKKYILRAVKVILIVLIATTLVINIFKTDKTISAGEHTITVNKLSTVSVYLSGPGVILESSNKDKDVYKVDTGTTVTFHAVNESRIFTGWSILNGTTVVNDDTTSVTTQTVTSDLTVSVTRRDATTADYGKYMLDRFVISDQEELIALQNILAGSNANADFAHFYSAQTDYDTPDEKNVLRENLRTGYFLIANNFVVFDAGFSGIGTNGKPFEGVMCGLNNGVVSSLFVTLSTTEVGGTQSYGLFKYLGPNAVIRNLKVVTTIGMKEAAANVTNGIQYIGGLTGHMNDSLLINVNVESKMGISVKNSVLHVGGIAGITTSGTGFESVGNVKYNGDGTSWTIQSESGSQINAGLIAGSATNTYVNSLNINVTDSVVDLKADGNSTLTLGNVFGNYTCTTTTTLQNINIVGSKGQILRTVAQTGESNVGGLIGKISDDPDATDRAVSIGKVDFNVLGSKSTYISTTAGTSSTANLYTGGLIGQVSSAAICNALDSFKNRLSEVTVDESKVKVFDYLFEGDYEITSVQNGTETSTSNTKSIAGGLVGNGIMNINGTSDTARSSLVFASPTSSLKINATQSKLSSIDGTRNDKEHACAGLIYGTVGSASININNFDIYSNNTTIETLREIGSKALGDLHTGGIVGFIEASTIQNVGIYLNDSSIMARSLSYEKTNTNEDTNSAYCGGVVGQATDNSTIDNVIFAGYNISNASMVGTTSTLEAIQNTIPGTKFAEGNNNKNYTGENYIGGLVGRMQHTKVSNCKYIGSEGSSDYIKMSGHESPDSAFCGGIVGIVRTATNDVPSSIQNCEIVNAYIYATATNVEKCNDPDIYVGGILGAAYMHNTNSTLEISGCHVYNTDIYGLGNDHMAVYVGGILGGATWENDIVTISDSYVVNSNITAKLVASSTASYTRKDNSRNEIESAASGIAAATINNAVIHVLNCAVIDSIINAHTNYINKDGSYNTGLKSYAAGFGAFRQNNGYTITNCYSNALVSALAELNSAKRQDGYDETYALAAAATINNIVETEMRVGGNAITNYNFHWISDTTCKISTSSGGYLRINNGNLQTSASEARGTTFTYSGNRLSYSTGGWQPQTYYLTYNSNTFGSDSNSQNGTNFTKHIDSYGYTYYLSKNVVSEDDRDTAVPSTGFKVVTGTPVNIYNTLNTALFNNADGYGQKMYFDPISSDFISTRTVGALSTIHCNDMTQYHSALVNVWVNAKENGDTTTFTGSPLDYYGSMEKANNAGWFIFDTVIVNNGVTADVSSTTISEVDSDYVDISGSKYEYSEYENSESKKVTIVTKDNDETDKIEDRYFESKESGNYKYRLRVYDDMLSLRLNITFAQVADYNMVISAKDDLSNPINLATANSNYGTLEFLVENNGYVLVFNPKEDIETNQTFYIGFEIGDTETYVSNRIVIELIHNEIKIVGVTYADYTPPLNYYITDGSLGTTDEPYQVYVGSITKFIPMIKKTNDPHNRTYVLEEYIERYNYTIETETGNVGTIYSSGELIASATANIKGTLTLIDKINGTNKIDGKYVDGKYATVHLITVNQYTVTYNITGADTEGLTYATSSTDFYFEQILRSNYSGVPTTAKITSGSNELDITSNPSKYPKCADDCELEHNHNNYVLVYEMYEDGTISANPITSWDADAYGYIIRVGTGFLSGAVTVTFEYPIVYTITFNLQCDTFNSSYTEIKKYKVHTDVSYKDFFKKGTTGSAYEEIMNWAEGATIFGYVFKGFYMVDFASTLPTYGISFDELVASNNNVTASITLYARWSFLIELIEAPGTTIVSSFPSSFMEEHYEEDKFNRTIQIPINLNEGYVFTIEKDSTFKGEASVAAYSIQKNGDSHIITEIVLEKYHDNMYLYYVLPEYITGYLVIVTSVSNAEIIVGENTSSVAEEILPEDGVSTFKYIVNHKNVPANGDIPAETSYIFNSGKDIDGDGDFNDDRLYNLSVTKDFRLYFYKEVYSAGTVTRVPRTLAIGTEIKIYYTVYYNDDKNTTENIVAVYRVTSDDISYVSINDFTLMDLYTPAFTPKTFGTFMGSNQVVSEIFYSVVTPPNGLSDQVHNEVVNYVIEGGFYDANYDNPDDDMSGGSFVSGIRSGNELANKDDLDFDDVQSLLIESSLESKVFAVTPSRVTNVTKSGDTYTFTDKLTFELCQVIFTQTDIHGDYVPLYDDTRQSTIESNEFKFDIKELRLSLGYGLGKVRIYGLKGGKWIQIEEIDVENAVYSEYKVSFMSDTYNGFKIDNVSTNEIRLNKLDIVSRSNGYVYSTTSDYLKEVSSVGNVHTYSLLEHVVGDTRHDSKSFMLAVQLKDGSGIVEDIRGSVYITVNGINYYALIDQTGTINYGKTTAFINLTSIIDILRTESFDFTLTIPSGYTIHTVQLIESDNSNKPAMGEVRIKDIQ